MVSSCVVVGVPHVVLVSAHMLGGTKRIRLHGGVESRCNRVDVLHVVLVSAHMLGGTKRTHGDVVQLRRACGCNHFVVGTLLHRRRTSLLFIFMRV